MDQNQDVFRWVFLCTGNRCRSPFTASYVIHLLKGIPVEITSAGTLQREGLAVPQELVEISKDKGLSLSEHRSRIADSSLSGADLVVGFELSHVAHAVVELGATPARTFTLPELARLLDKVRTTAVRLEDPIEEARRCIAIAARMRESQDSNYESVTDPFGGPVKAYEEMATTVIELSTRVAGHLFPNAVSDPTQKADV